MKVFLSWSGEKSHKVAKIFREWLPSVIQNIVPYVSSEDIDKGARWSTDIASELEEASFGILCVTPENLNAPWLNFEAGALSKTIDKSFVSPFLFEISRSQVQGPILQFQSTIFSKDEIRKLLMSLNKASDNKLTDERLDKALDAWYPQLEESLNELKSTGENSENALVESAEDNSRESFSGVLEEILELSRTNQKLLRNPNTDIVELLDKLQSTMKRNEVQQIELVERRRKSPRRFPSRMIEEVIFSLPNFKRNYTNIQIALSFFRSDFPWLYESGMDLVNKLRSNSSSTEKEQAISEFDELVDFTFSNPIVRDHFYPHKELLLSARELPYLIRRSYENSPN